MTVRFRYTLGLTLTLLAAAAAHPTLARAAGVDFWNLTDVRAEAEEAAERSRVLDERDSFIMRRIIIKEDLVTGLIAGRTSLADVAVQFLDLNSAEPSYLDHLRTSVPGDSDLERSAHNVLHYASARLADPTARAAVLARLEAELVCLQDADHPALR